MKRIAHIALMALMLPIAGIAAAEDLFDPETGLRIASYRAPVPETVDGARVIDAAGAAALADRGALLLDVIAAPGYLIEPDGEWVVSETHDSIAGSVWLPEVGRGVLEDGIEGYLSQSLATCTGKDKAHPIVIFCRSDCWMSWNAIRRISDQGYENLYWLRGGIEEWLESSRPGRIATPLPVGARSCG